MSDNHADDRQATTDDAGNGRKPECPPPPEMSPRLLRRLAEAALGDHGREPQWWVCRFEAKPPKFKYDIKGPFGKAEEAEEYRKSRDRPEEFGVFGPYRLTEGQVKPLPPSVKVETVTITFTGQANPVRIRGDEFDALFWGPFATEKFVYPYYTTTAGIDYAVVVRDDYYAGKALIMAHSEDTEYRVFKVEPGPREAPLEFEPILHPAEDRGAGRAENRLREPVEDQDR